MLEMQKELIDLALREEAYNATLHPNKLRNVDDLVPMVKQFLREREYSIREGYYISGRVTGLERKEVKRLFKRADKVLLNYIKSKKLNIGYFLNPSEVIHKECEWRLAMAFCISVLPFFDTIVMLPNWTESEGASIEHELAERLGLQILYINEDNTGEWII